MSARAISWLNDQYRCVLDRMRLREFLAANPLLHFGPPTAAAAVGRSVIEPLEQRRLLAATVNQPEWIEQGPGPILGGQTAGLIAGLDAVAGAVDVIAPDPTDLDRIFVGTVNGGIWRTNDGQSAFGGTWRNLTPHQSTLSITDLKFSPLDATRNTLFAATGQNSSGKRDVSSRWPTGLIRTVNASADNPTWTQVGKQLAGQNIRRIIPTKIGTSLADQVVLAGGSKGLYRSTDGGVRFAKVSETSGSGLPKGAVSDLIADPLNDQLFYAAVPGKGIYRSVDGTGGANWDLISGSIAATINGSTNLSLSLHHTASANFLWAAIVKNTGTANAPSYGLTNVFRYSVAAGTWNQFLSPPTIHPGGQGNQHMSMLADKDDPGVIYIAGDRQANSPFVANIVRGDIGGQTWVPYVLNDDDTTTTIKEGAAGTAPHADSRFMIFHGDDILEGDDGGIYRLVKPNADPFPLVGRYWESVNGNLRPNETYSIGYDSVNDVIIGGSQDTGAWQQSDAQQFAGQVLQGDGFIQGVDDGFGAGPIWRYRMGNTFRTFNRDQYNNTNTKVGASQRVMLASSATPTVPMSGLSAQDQARSTSGPTEVVTTRPFAINAVASNRMLIGDYDLYESTDGGMTVTQVTPAGINWMTAIAYGGGRQGNSSQTAAYVGDDFGQLFIRKNGAAAFSKSASFPSSKKQPIRGIIVSQQDWKKAYVVTRTQVYRTTDGGDSWTTITGNLGKLTTSIHSIELFHDVATPNVEVVLIGGRGGVFRCSNPSAGSNAKWSAFGKNLPKVVVTDVELGENFTLVASTFGRGVFKIKNVNASFAAGGGGAGAFGFGGGDPIITADTVIEITGDDGANLNDSFRLARNPDNPLMLDVFQNGDTPILTAELATIDKIVVTGGEGDDTLTLDHANGLVSVGLGIQFDGGAGNNSQQDVNYTDIPTSVKDRLVGGLQQFADWAGTLADIASVAQDLPGVEASLRDALGVGDASAPITGALQQGFVGRLVNYFADDLTPTAQELVDFVKTLSAPTGALEFVIEPDSVSGGLISTGSSQRLEFGVNLQFRGEKDDIALDFGAAADQLGIAFDASALVDLWAGLELDFRFGVDLSPGLDLADAFYVSVNQLAISGAVRGAHLDFGLNLGFLEAGIEEGYVELGARAVANFGNPDGDENGLLTLSEIVNNPLSAVVDVSASGSLKADLPVNVSLAGLSLPSKPVVKVRSSDFFNQAPTVTIDNLGDLANFKDLSFQNILDMLQSALGYLRNLEQFDFLNEKLPLIDRSVADVLDTADSFSERLEELRNNPAGSLQAVEAQIEQFFGIEDSSLVELTADGGQTLKLKLNFLTDFDEQLPLDFALTDLPGLPEELASIIDLNGSGSLHVTGGASFGLALGLDVSTPAQPAAFLYGQETRTSLLAKVETDTPIDFTFSIFGIGAAINDATFELHKMGDSSKPAAFTVALDDGGDGRIYFSELTTLSTSDVLVSLDGAAHLNMPFEFPPGTPIDDALDVTVPNLAALFTGGANPVVVNSYPDFNAILANLDLSGDLGSLLNALNQLLGLLQTGMDNGALAKKVPLIGDRLDEAADVIERFRTDLLAELQAFIDDPTAKTLPMVRARLFEALGPGATGLGVLADGPDAGTNVNATDVWLFLDSLTSPRDVRFDLNLERTASLVPLSFDFDLGLPALGLSVDGDVAVEAGFKLKTGFGFSKDVGAYLRVQEPNDLEVGVHVTTPGLTARGRLGFLQLDVTDDATFFDANFRFDLASNDGRLTISELTNSVFHATLDGGARADVNLKLALSYENQANFPRILADLNLDWAFGNADTAGSGAFGAAPLVAFNNVKLDLGSFLSRFAGPVLDSINRALDPVRPVVDFLSKEIPMLAKVESVRNFFDRNRNKRVTVSEIIQTLDPSAVLSFVDGVSALADLLTAAQSTSVGANTVVNLGSFNLNNVDLRAHQNLDNVPLTNFNALPTAAQLETLAPDFAGALDDDRLGTTGSDGGGGLSFPILQSPREVFSLFMGKDPDLFLWDMPRFSADLEIDESFPVFGPIEIGFGGRVGIEADLTFGYDTSGLRKLANGGSAADVFDGFFLLDMPAGATEDPAEIRAFGEIFIKAEVDAAIVSGEVKGSLLGTLDLNLHDPDNTDGTNKVRIDDLNAQLNKGLLCLFDIAGELSAVISGKIKVGIGRLSKTWSMNFAKIHLLDFTHTCDDTPPPAPVEPILASVESDGILRLHMGPYAPQRVHGGDIVDNDESFSVSPDPNNSGGVIVSAYGYNQAYSGFTKIVGEGGLGNDTIDIGAGVNFPAELWGDFADPSRAGEFGNDNLTGGDAAATIRGGGGDDAIIARSAADSLYGDAGNDAIHGGDGADLLEGGDGSDTLDGEGGNDTAHGGAGDDLVQGGDGADLLHGNAGDDDLIGDDEGVSTSGASLNDTAHGGEGNDLIQGLFGDDRLFGDAGNDSISGDVGNDKVHGGAGDDDMSGDDGEDYMEGNGGTDTMVGGGGEDDMVGGSSDLSVPAAADRIDGADDMDGGAGHDVMAGDNARIVRRVNASNALLRYVPGATPGTGVGAENNAIIRDVTLLDLDSLGGGDVMTGVGGDDTMFGGFGNDQISGNDGNDDTTGHLGADTMDGGAGSDGIIGDKGIIVTDLLDGSQTRIIVSNSDKVSETIDVAGTLKRIVTLEAPTIGGADLIIGGLGDDFVHAGAGNDVLHGDDTALAGGGKDALFGNLGDDVIFGGAGNDHLWGGSGADNLDGQAGADTAFGGDGDDRLVADIVDDRLMDWSGNSNLFVVPGTGFGSPTILRLGNPHVRAFLLLLAAGDGSTDPDGEAVIT